MRKVDWEVKMKCRKKSEFEKLSKNEQKKCQKSKIGVPSVPGNTKKQEYAKMQK